MPIKRFMAPTMNVPETCTNCKHRREKSGFKRCVACGDKATGGNLFPLWEAAPVEEVE